MDDHKKLLIVDDDEINRDLLAFMFARDNIDLIEAVNGAEAWDIICGRKDEIMAVLLDLNMPVMDGYEFLTRMNDGGLIKEIPVFIITAEDDENTLMRCFNMGAIDIITKPFSATLIHRRLFNNIELFMLRNILEEKVREQTKEIMRKQWQLEQMNRYIMEALSTVIEFRDLESGEHVHRIRDVTRVFLNVIAERYPEYDFKNEDIELISDAAVMHDIGKIMVPDAILNKPGPLTPDERAVMQLHTVNGCSILETITALHTTPYYKYCYEICRWHHERWDGRGYPDRLVGDEIPIWAQAVSLADVYDALVSDRVYHKALPHETAMRMIKNGDCGAFSYKMLDCLNIAADTLLEMYKTSAAPKAM